MKGIPFTRKDWKEIGENFFWALVILALVILVTGIPASAWNCDFQDADESACWREPYATAQDYHQYPADINESKAGFYTQGGGTCPAANPYLLNFTGAGSQFDYFAVTSRFYYHCGMGTNLQVYFYNAAGTTCGSALVVGAAPYTAGATARWEYVITAGNLARLYFNGSWAGAGNVTLTCNPTRIVLYPAGTGQFWFDDVTFGSTYPNVLGAIPSYYYLRKDMLNPGLTGMYVSTTPLGTIFNTSYSLGTEVSGHNYTTGGMTIATTHLTSGVTYNTTTIPSGTFYGFIRYDMEDLLVDTGAPYGIYKQTLYHDGSYQDQKSFFYMASGADVEWDAETYNVGTSDAVVVSIVSSGGYWDPAIYDYEGRVYDLEDGTLITSWVVSAATQSETLDISTWESGDYVATLVATDSSGNEYWMDYDIATFTDTVTLAGVTYDAAAGTALTTTNVNATQSSEWFNTTSDGTTAEYELTLLSSGAEINITATKATYTHTPVLFTPPLSGTYAMDLYLLPTWTGTTAIRGIVWNDEYQAISGATVNIWNASWSDTTTSSATGYYEFIDLVNASTYFVNATKTAYDQEDDNISVTTGTGGAVTQDIRLLGNYPLTVNIVDYSSGAPLAGVNVTIAISDGQSATTSTASQSFTMDYGIWTVTASAVGYSGDSSNIFINDISGETLTLHLRSSSETTGGAGYAYPPHNVKYVLRNIWGSAISDADVSCQGVETTAGAWDWFTSLLGMPLDEAPIHNASMTGTTGSDGSIDFMMLEAVKYDCTFTSASGNATWSGYPKDDYYEIWVVGTNEWFEGGESELEEVNITISETAINTTAANISVRYIDNMSDTTGGTIHLNQTNKTATDLPQVEIDDYTIASSNFTTYFVVTGKQGECYFVNVDAAHTTFGSVNRTYSVCFKEAPVTMGLPSEWMLYVAMFLIMFTGMFFGATTAPTMGALISSFMGWICYFVGWLDSLDPTVSLSALTFATFISILSIVMVRSKKERYV